MDNLQLYEDHLYDVMLKAFELMEQMTSYIEPWAEEKCQFKNEIKRLRDEV